MWFIFHILSVFRIFHQSAHIAYFPPHKLAFSTAILIFTMFLLPISITFHYLNHLVANRMAPSMCPATYGRRPGSLFQAILYHISAQGCGTTQTSQWFRFRLRVFTGSGSSSGSGPAQQAKTNTTRLRLSTRCFLERGTYTMYKLVAHGCRLNSRYRIVREDQD